MAAHYGNAPDSARRRPGGAQTFITLAMGLVAIAAGVAMHSHMDLPAPIATTVALAAYVLLFAIHSLVWRPARDDVGRPAAVRAVTDRGEQELRRAKAAAGKGWSAVAATQTGAKETGANEQRPAPRAAPALAGLTPRAAPAPIVTGPLVSEARASAELARPSARTAASAPAQPTLAAPAGAPASRPAFGPAERSVPPPPPSADSVQDYWSYRPAAPRLELPPFVTGRVPAGAVEPSRPPAPSPAAGPPPLPTTAAPREADVEVVQDAIKRLLEEVNANELLGTSTGAAQSANGAHGAEHQTGPAKGTRPHTEAAIDSSLAALRVTADTMRAAKQPHAPPSPPPPPIPTAARAPSWTPPPMPGPARGAPVADAIAAGRIDVLLEPILGLDDRRTRHFEVLVRLRDAAGQPLGESGDLRGTGLLPRLDCAHITRTGAVARRLDERGKAGSIFTRVSAESLVDETFLGELAEAIHRRAGFAGQLVLAFAQDDVRGFGTPEWETIADMRTLGLRFAVAGIADLDMDFAALVEAGFGFAKLDAATLLAELRVGAGRIPGADVCRHLAGAGLAVVVEHITEEASLARISSFGVVLGQGQLFGGPRPIKASAVAGRSEAAA